MYASMPVNSPALLFDTAGTWFLASLPLLEAISPGETTLHDGVFQGSNQGTLVPSLGTGHRRERCLGLQLHHLDVRDPGARPHGDCRRRQLSGQVGPDGGRVALEGVTTPQPFRASKKRASPRSVCDGSAA
jgi:hypothetical protein